MSNHFVNFFPGSVRDSRELSLDTHAAYGVEDIEGFVDSILVGCTSSAPTDGALAALEDGSVWGYLCDKHGEVAAREALEELHALLLGR